LKSHAGKKMPKRKKILLTGICLFVSVLFLVIAGVLFYVHSDHARHQIQTRINDRIPGKIMFKDYTLALTKGKIELGNILLEDPEGRVVAGIDQLELRILWKELFNRNIALQQIYIKNPQVRLIVDPDGNLSLLRVFASQKAEEFPEPPKSQDETERSFNLMIHDFLLENGAVIFENPSQGSKANLENIRLNFSGDLGEQAGLLYLSTGKGAIETPDLQAGIETLKLSGSIKEEQIKNLRAEIKTPSSIIELAGSAKHILSEPELEMIVDLGLHLPEIREMFFLEPEYNGTIKGKLSAKGPVKNPEVSLGLSYSGGQLGNLEIKKSTFRAIVQDRIIRLTPMELKFVTGSIHLDAKADLQEVFPEGFLSKPKSPESLSYYLNMDINNVNLKEALDETFEGKGHLNGSISAKGSGISLENAIADLQLNLSGFEVTTGSMTPVDIHIKSIANLNQGEAVLDTFDVRAGPTALSSTGLFDIKSKRIESHLKVDSKNLTDTLAPLGVKGAQGAVNLEVKASGTLDRPVFELFLKGREVHIENASIGNVDMMASLDNSGTLKVLNFDLENQGSVVKANGTIQLFDPNSTAESIIESLSTFDATLPLKFDLLLKNVTPTNFISTVPISGILNGTLSGEGNLTKLFADLQLTGANLASDDLQIGNIDLSANFSEGKLWIQKAELKNHSSHMEISGTLDIFERYGLKPLDDPIVDIKINADPVFLEDFIEEAKAKVFLNAKIKGTIKNPKGDYELKAENIDFNGQNIEYVLIKGNIADEKIHFTPFQILFAADQSIDGSGWIATDKKFQFKLFSKGIFLNQINKIREQNISEGMLVLNLTGEGSLDNPHIKGALSIKELVVNKKELGDFQIDLSIADFLAKAAGRLNFDFSATYHLNKKDFTVDIHFDDTDLSPYFNLSNLKNFSGKVSGKLQASGNTSNIKQITGGGEFLLLNLFMQEQELVHAENFDIIFKNNQVLIPDLKIRLLESGNLNIGASADLNGSLRVKADASIPLQGLQIMTSHFPDISGKIQISANVGGTTTKPDIHGEILLDQIEFTIPELSQKLHDLSGRIVITPEVLNLEKIQGNLDTGQIELSGKVTLKDLNPEKIKLDLSARALPVKVPGTLNVLVQSNLSLSGTLDKAILEGDLIILEGVYYKDIHVNLVEGITQRRRQLAPEKPAAAHPMLKNLELDISIRRRNPLWVDNNLAYLDVNPDIRIVGTAEQPLIQGRTTIESGTIQYQKKTFTVQKGVIDFINPYEVEPILDIESSVKIRKWLITMTLYGTPDNMLLTLTSDPPEEDGDIISLLVLGKTTGELISREGGTSRSTEQMAAELIASTFGEDIKKMTGLDVFEVETARDDDLNEESEGVMVTVGKKLSERLTVKYSMDSRTGEMIQHATSEYQFLENIILSAFQNTAGIFGGEIQYRLEFR
jgi:translocation and assembly module TamB